MVVRLYSGQIVGDPIPQAEIEEKAWLDLSRPGSLPLAPSMVNTIVPHLRRTLRKGRGDGGSGAEAGEQSAQDLFQLV